MSHGFGTGESLGWGGSCRHVATTEPTGCFLSPAPYPPRAPAICGYAMLYLPVSITFCAMAWRNPITLNGSYLASLRRIASCERSMSPSAQAAITERAALSILYIAPAIETRLIAI